MNLHPESVSTNETWPVTSIKARFGFVCHFKLCGWVNKLD